MIHKCHWYRTVVTRCPGCDKEEIRKERVYDWSIPPSADPKRHVYREEWCGSCLP